MMTLISNKNALLGICLAAAYSAFAAAQTGATVNRGYTIPLIDLSGETNGQFVVDREAGQYLGHPTTVLLEDGKTMICVYPKGHGSGAIVMKRSADGGKTWSERLPTPESWATSKETPTIHRLVDSAGKKRLTMWSGLYPARLAVSEDDGKIWSELKKAGDWGGIVVMGFVEPLKTGPGNYLAMFHDDGRFFAENAWSTASRSSRPASGTFDAVAVAHVAPSASEQMRRPSSSASSVSCIGGDYFFTSGVSDPCQDTSFQFPPSEIYT